MSLYDDEHSGNADAFMALYDRIEKSRNDFADLVMLLYDHLNPEQQDTMVRGFVRQFTKNMQIRELLSWMAWFATWRYDLSKVEELGDHRI